MTISIAVSFTAGHFHATPWGRHANEGVTEWPVSPWRLLRALAASWKRTLADDTRLGDTAEAIFSALASPPIFKLPTAVIGQSRHYMPWYKTGPQDKTLVFDNFVALGREEQVGLLWPDAHLSEPQLDMLARLLENLNYLGRAESWCEARICHDWHSLPGQVCGWRDAVTGELGPYATLADVEPVRVLCANMQTWKAWHLGPQASRPEPQWNLLAETLDLHAERWSDPPGSRWLTYLRPLQALVARPASRPINAESIWYQPWGASAEHPPEFARFSLDSTVLPRLTETVYTAEIARRRAQGIYGRMFDKAASALFSGKTNDGEPRHGHRHASFLPTDEDADGRLDHLTIWSPDGLGLQELQALSELRVMHAPDTSAPVNLMLLGFGYARHFPAAAIVQSARLWRSITPFVPTRHYKMRGLKRDQFPRHQLAEINLREELQRRGLPEPVRIERLPTLMLAGRPLAWREFRQQRLFGVGRRGNHFGAGFLLEFDQPITGPLALGYACHFGLGLFAPAGD